MSHYNNVYCKKVQPIFIDFEKLEQNLSELRIFRIKLSLYYHLVDDFLQFLTPEEVKRAERYFSPKDKKRFIISKTLLKFILAQKTGLNLTDIIFNKDKNKKPYLASHKSICFNVSHSENYAIIALNNHAIGVDVEYINKNFDFSEILPSTFSDLEIESVLNENNNEDAFYTIWTRKEAFVKATGKGIDDNFPQIPSLNGCHSVAANLMGDCQNLKIFGFDLDIDYKAAVAFEGTSVNSEEILIYNLPTSMYGLMSLINKV